MRALPSSFVRHLYFPAVQHYKGERLLQNLQALRSDRHLSTSLLRKRQWREVQALIQVARQSPFWAERLSDIPDPISPEDFARLPILTKDDLRQHGDALLVPSAPIAQKGSTSGSTGVSVTIQISHAAQESNFAWQWFARSWYGVQLGDPGLWVWGRPIYSAYKRFLSTTKARLNNMMLVPSFDLSEEVLAEWWPKIKEFRPVYIYGYTSAIDRLAEFIEAHDRVDFPVKVVFIAAEQLYDFQRQRISRVFHAPVANEYGCVETGSIAYECPQGSWHLATEHTYTEFLNEDGTPVQPGELGQVIVTALHNRAMPLIRYRLGDMGGPSEAVCACGRPWPLMAMGVGRSVEMVKTKSGRVLSGQMFHYINRGLQDQHIRGIQAFRVIQRTLDNFVVEYVPEAGNGHTPDIGPATRFFQDSMRGFIGNDITVDLKPVAEIKPEPSGKLRYFISELPDSYLHTNLPQ